MEAGSMRRMTMIATAVYGLAWFLPVVSGSTGLEQGGVPGWEALRMALAPVFPIDGFGGDQGFLAMIGVLSGLSNLWFVASFVVLALFPRGPRRVMFWGLVLATLVNTVWLWGAGGVGYLRAGYYLWLLSFVGLAAAARRAPTELARVSAAATAG
jgi:hypothetical protein